MQLISLKSVKIRKKGYYKYSICSIACNTISV